MNRRRQTKGLVRTTAIAAFAGLLMSWAQAGFAAASTLQEVKDSGKLIVCGVDGLLPYSSSDEEIPGFEVEIARAMASKMGVEAKYVWVTWDALIPALTSNRCNAIINGMFITEERDKVIDFSAPYYASGETILVPKNDDSVKGLEHLDGKTVGVLAGSVTVGYLEKKAIGNLKVYPDQNTIILELNNGRIDAAFLEAPSAAWTLQNDPTMNIKIVESYVPDKRWNAGVGVREADDELKKAFSQIISELRADGTIREILDSYNVPYYPVME